MESKLLENLRAQKKLERDAANAYSNMPKYFSGKDAKTIRRIIEDEKEHERLVGKVIQIVESAAARPAAKGAVGAFDRKVENNFAGFLEGFFSILCITGIKNYIELNGSILKYMLNSRKKKAVYVSVNKLTGYLRRLLADAGVNTGEISIVSCAFGDSGSAKVPGTVCINPKDLTYLSIEMEKLAEKNRSAFVFFDSVSALSVYHKPDAIEKFVSFVNESMEQKGIGVVWISFKEPSEEALNKKLSMFCEKVAEF